MNDFQGIADLHWRKGGRIIKPENAPAWRCAHSGMVSALPWESGGYRVFLTGRDVRRGFQIGWIDFDHDFSIIHEPSTNPVLTAGRMGCFDCQGVCMPCVVRLSDSVLYMYYVGWGLATPGMLANQCGLAISRDNGKSWSRWSEAPLPLLDALDPIGIGTVFVLRDSPDAWRMWYTTFCEWRELDDGTWCHYYHIKFAESDNGIVWRKPIDNLAIDFAADDEYAVARPMVLQEENKHRMWFSCRSIGSTYRIGYAESVDGRRWTRIPSGMDPSPGKWDSDMVEYAYVVRQSDEYVMLYNGNGFGAAGTGIARAKLKKTAD